MYLFPFSRFQTGRPCGRRGEPAQTDHRLAVAHSGCPRCADRQAGDGQEQPCEEARAAKLEPPDLAGVEVADLICFVTSERAGYITGTSIAVDGGWTRGLF